MICNKKYHFLLPSKDSIVVACLGCKGDDSMDADLRGFGKPKLLAESERQVMHGVVHSNGFGHLLCINGLETGSDLSGHQIIQFWDRLCTGLRVRLVFQSHSYFSNIFWHTRVVLGLNIFLIIKLCYMFNTMGLIRPHT